MVPLTPEQKEAVEVELMEEEGNLLSVLKKLGLPKTTFYKSLEGEDEEWYRGVRRRRMEMLRGLIMAIANETPADYFEDRRIQRRLTALQWLLSKEHSQFRDKLQLDMTNASADMLLEALKKTT